jgi:CBS domain-containing protein/sporulation protein YlmC with PRC-barrel domain
MNVTDSNGGPRYYLTDILGTKVILHGKKVGRLADLVIVETEPFPEVTKLFVRRPFWEPSLMIPWEKVKVLKESEIVVSFEDLKTCEGTPKSTDILLKDHILDKKVLDIEDREVEVVYDVKLTAKQNKLLVSDVNISRYRFFRRLGLKFFANLFYNLRGKVKDHKIPWRFIQPLPSNIGSFKGDVKLKVLKETLSEIHPADLADILEELDSSQRVAIFNELESGRASDTLEEIDPTVQRDLVSAMKKERVAQLLSAMTPGQAADILSVLPLSDTRAILHVLRTLNMENAHKIESILGKQEERIANFATNKIIKLNQSTPVDKAREYFNSMAKYMDIIMYIYVTDDQERLVGVMDLKELLQAKPDQTLKEVMIDGVITLSPHSTLKEALEYFSRYEFRALPVIDEHHKLLGAVPFRDVMNLKHRFLE